MAQMADSRMLAQMSCCSAVELAISCRAASGRRLTAPLTEAISRSRAVGGGREGKSASPLPDAWSIATWLERSSRSVSEPPPERRAASASDAPRSAAPCLDCRCRRAAMLERFCTVGGYDQPRCRSLASACVHVSPLYYKPSVNVNKTLSGRRKFVRVVDELVRPRRVRARRRLGPLRLAHRAHWWWPVRQHAVRALRRRAAGDRWTDALHTRSSLSRRSRCLGPVV